MKELSPNETALIGKWIAEEPNVVGDEVCCRIEWLISNVLEAIALGPEYGAWERLYRNPKDGAYWERSYPLSEMHGGGPPALTKITSDEARKKYRIE